MPPPQDSRLADSIHFEFAGRFYFYYQFPETNNHYSKNMLESFYSKKEDIPADKRGAYVEKNGRWEVDEYAPSHPLVAKKDEFKAKYAVLKPEFDRLQREKTTLETKTIPDGKVAADPDIVELGETAKSHGLSKKEIPTLKTDVEKYKGEVETIKTTEIARKVAAAAGKNPEAWAEHVTAKALKFKEVTTKDDKGNDVTSFMVVTSGDGDKEVETPLRDYVDKNSVHVAAADKKTARRYGFPKEEVESGESNEFDEIRKSAEEKNKSATTDNQSFSQKFFGNGSGINP